MSSGREPGKCLKGDLLAIHNSSVYGRFVQLCLMDISSVSVIELLK